MDKMVLTEETFELLGRPVKGRWRSGHRAKTVYPSSEYLREALRPIPGIMNISAKHMVDNIDGLTILGVQNQHGAILSPKSHGRP